MQNGKILVIDDERLVCDLIEQILEMKGLNVTTMTNSANALKEIEQKNDYDVIISDIRMPKVSGIDLLRIVNEQKTNCQFILITGFYNLVSSDIEKHLKPFSLIRKPFDINVLMTSVDNALKKKYDIDRSLQNIE